MGAGQDYVNSDVALEVCLT